MPRPTKLNQDTVIPIIQLGVAKKESKVEIARKLGISRNTLHYWIATYPEIKKLFTEVK